jgi:hypothetical protein
MHQLYHLLPPQPGGQATLKDLITICRLRDGQLTNSCTGRPSRLAARFTLPETGGGGGGGGGGGARSSNIISKFSTSCWTFFRISHFQDG